MQNCADTSLYITSPPRRRHDCALPCHCATPLRTAPALPHNALPRRGFALPCIASPMRDRALPCFACAVRDGTGRCRRSALQFRRVAGPCSTAALLRCAEHGPAAAMPYVAVHRPVRRVTLPCPRITVRCRLASPSLGLHVTRHCHAAAVHRFAPLCRCTAVRSLPYLAAAAPFGTLRCPRRSLPCLHHALRCFACTLPGSACAARVETAPCLRIAVLCLCTTAPCLCPARLCSTMPPLYSTEPCPCPA